MKMRIARDRALRLLAFTAVAAALVAFGEHPGLTRAFSQPPIESSTKVSRHADFRDAAPSDDARRIADWALGTGNHEGLPFIVVDKRSAKAYVFDAGGVLIELTPALLGMGVGDAFEPGVVNMSMYETKPSQRITPAGRFKAEEWQKPSGEWILWLDYSSQIALHKLRPSQLALSQEREKRLYSQNPADSRVTFGCVNVPPAFYDRVITPAFNARGGIVYVLPDSGPVVEFFEAQEHERRDRAAVSKA